MGEFSFSSMVLVGLGAATGALLTLAAVRAWGVVYRFGRQTAILELPWRLQLELRWQREPDGLYLDEAEEMLEKLRRLNRLIDFHWLLPYARKYRIRYIGFKGAASEHWKPGCLACSTLEFSPLGGYRIYLNPDLPLPETARRLSEELGFELKPEEVHPFLFLHEIGHTPEAGNVCFISASINTALSGGRRTHRRRRELQSLKLEVERRADAFATSELLRWRSAGRLGCSPQNDGRRCPSAL